MVGRVYCGIKWLSCKERKTKTVEVFAKTLAAKGGQFGFWHAGFEVSLETSDDSFDPIVFHSWKSSGLPHVFFSTLLIS
jgi:hypothetical protein